MGGQHSDVLAGAAGIEERGVRRLPAWKHQPGFFAELLQRPNLARMARDIQAGVEMCRERCEYFSVCGGGEPANKLAENGTFVSTETTYCRLTRMAATDLVLSALDRLQPDFAGDRANASLRPSLT